MPPSLRDGNGGSPPTATKRKPADGTTRKRHKAAPDAEFHRASISDAAHLEALRATMRTFLLHNIPECADMSGYTMPDGAQVFADPFDALGEPFMTYARLLVAADDAKRRLWAVRVAGEPNAVFAAEWDHAEAMSRLNEFKAHGAAVFLLYARFAAALFPGATQAHLDPVFRRELDVTQDAVRELEERVEEAENVIASLAVGEAVTT